MFRIGCWFFRLFQPAAAENPIAFCQQLFLSNSIYSYDSHVIHLMCCIYNLQISKVRWTSTFRIEVNGSKSYGLVEGRNGHYGKQSYWVGTHVGGKIDEIEDTDSFFRETREVLYPIGTVIK